MKNIIASPTDCAGGIQPAEAAQYVQHHALRSCIDTFSTVVWCMLTPDLINVLTTQRHGGNPWYFRTLVA